VDDIRGIALDIVCAMVTWFLFLCRINSESGTSHYWTHWDRVI